VDVKGITDEIARKVNARVALAVETPACDLVATARASLDAIVACEDSIPGAQAVADHAVAVAACGIVLAARGACAEDALYRRDAGGNGP